MALAVDEATFTQDVLKSPVPVLVNFWAPWCGLCRVIHPLLNQLQSEFPGKIQLVNINADDNLKLATAYRLTSLPTLIVFDQGRVVRRLEDFHSRDELRTAIASLQSVIDAALVATAR
jgi:thioredoxin 1